MSENSTNEASASLSSPSPSSSPSSLASPRPLTGIEHNFYKRHFYSPICCNFCKEFLWGLSHGYSCEVCKYVAHSKCRRNAVLNCILPPTPRLKSQRSTMSLPTADPTEILEMKKEVEVSSSSSSSSSTVVLSITEHHWIEGNLSFGKKCKVCRSGFSFKGFDGVSCSKCNKACHNNCISKLDFPCSPKHVGLLFKEEETCNNNNESTLLLSNGEETTEDYHPQEGGGPLIAFINPKSGGQDGLFIFRKLKRLLSPAQVFDMTNGGPDAGLKEFVDVPNLRVLVCGGDGTACWVLSVLDKMKVSIYPAVGVLPLGTGNDLARALDWGGGYSREALSPILRQIEKADVIPMDRWNLTFTPYSDENTELNNNSSGYSNENENGKDKDKEEKTTEKGKEKDEDDSSEENINTSVSRESGDDAATTEATRKQMIMNNYFSIGVDAKVALKFHQLREEKPHYFKRRLVNKGWYGKFGFESMISAPEPLHLFIDLKIDGQVVQLGKDIEGLIVQNVPSYAAGCNIWGKEKGKFQRQSMSDGLLEIVGITGTFQMGRIQVGIGHGQRLGQANDIEIVCKRPVPAQIDGEPWPMQPSTIKITHFNRVNMLKRKKGKRERAASAKEPSSPASSSSCSPSQDNKRLQLRSANSSPSGLIDNSGVAATTASSTSISAPEIPTTITTEPISLAAEAEKVEAENPTETTSPSPAEISSASSSLSKSTEELSGKASGEVKGKTTQSEESEGDSGREDYNNS